MTTYSSPGVYVEQAASAIQPIAGVGTSTAAFIGVYTLRIADDQIPPQLVTGTADTFPLAAPPAAPPLGNITVSVDGKEQTVSVDGNEQTDAKLMTDSTSGVTSVVFSPPPKQNSVVLVSYLPEAAVATAAGEVVGFGDGTKVTFPLQHYPILPQGTSSVTVFPALMDASKTPPAPQDITGTLVNDSDQQKANVTLSTVVPRGTRVVVDYQWELTAPAVAAGTPILCTSFSSFTKNFGGFTSDPARNALVHAVYGFFNNGGTRCYVAWVPNGAGLAAAVTDVLTKLQVIDEIAIVAAPGQTDPDIQDAILDHCENLMNRFAVLDGQPNPAQLTSDLIRGPTRTSSFAAMYYPWITVYDPASDGQLAVAPSGHVAGIYARVDAQRGVYKAPANEVIRGALDVQPRLSDNDQGGLNQYGINVLRMFDSGVTVWGARTLGGNANEEWKYVSVRRLLIFLAQSIKLGTQWVVFEPNDAALWAKITRNVTAFLTLVWRSGALFGATPQQAFYVKCDAETNPEELRDTGQVTTEIGVAVTEPAEFVVFQISQWAGPGQ
jgi:phage tail sheath protein FI